MAANLSRKRVPSAAQQQPPAPRKESSHPLRGGKLLARTLGSYPKGWAEVIVEIDKIAILVCVLVLTTLRVLIQLPLALVACVDATISYFQYGDQDTSVSEIMEPVDSIKYELEMELKQGVVSSAVGKKAQGVAAPGENTNPDGMRRPSKPFVRLKAYRSVDMSTSGKNEKSERLPKRPSPTRHAHKRNLSSPAGASTQPSAPQRATSYSPANFDLLVNSSEIPNTTELPSSDSSEEHAPALPFQTKTPSVSSRSTSAELASQNITQPTINMARSLPNVQPNASQQIVVRAATLPFYGQQGAPNFTGRNVTSFLQDFDDLCKECYIVDAADKRSRILRYVAPELKEDFKIVDGYGSALEEYDEAVFYEALKKQYKHADSASLKNTVSFLEVLVDKARVSILDLKDYVVLFDRHSSNLIKSKKISEDSRCRMFVKGLPPKHRDKLMDKQQYNPDGENTKEAYETMLGAIKGIAESEARKRRVAEEFDEDYHTLQRNIIQEVVNKSMPTSSSRRLPVPEAPTQERVRFSDRATIYEEVENGGAPLSHTTTPSRSQSKSPASSGSGGGARLSARSSGGIEDLVEKLSTLTLG
ncbi:uncharacterized protein LY89DRAFT_415459 [Mollisia scopiformis]|uniref:Uncharacterized protein n=1 Tax=Mollisia scopiformis TaxID=149040 RepID=A0A132B1D9_MOLSC|nr:uncharacterized protein LY89DRAFT_415459 [Mollisia scopiformis]KUJ06200.1 hypothetical protein LY89DRAFT_415459 [Mollisia scopiformis]